MESSPFDIAQDGNLFPREDLLEAVAESDWRDQDVPLATWVLTALGITIVAAGLPVARLIVMAPVEFAATAPPPYLYPIHALALLIGRTGIGIEAAFFLLSAIALGLCLPAIGLALRAAGFGGRLAFAAALIAVTSPLLVLQGRLPTEAPFIVLGGALVLAATAAPIDSGRAGERGYALRLMVALAIAHLFHAHVDLLVIPAVIAVFTRTTHGRLVHALGLLVVTIALSDVLDPNDLSRWPPDLFGTRLDVLLAGGVAWAVVPLAWRRESEEQPPPRWLVTWLVFALLLAVIANRTSAVALLVVPALAVFVANLLARCARPDRALRWALGLGIGQAALAALTCTFAPTSTTSFAAIGPGETQPTDIVDVDDAGSIVAYLLRRRLGLTVCENPPGTITCYIAPASKSTPARRLLSLGRPRIESDWILNPETGEVTPRE